MRVWRTPDGEYVVEGPPVRATVVGRPIRTAGGEPVTGAHEYHHLDASGAVLRVYEHREFSSEDELFGTVHRVVGAALVSYHTVVNTARWAVNEPSDSREEVEVDGLAPVPAEAVFGADPDGVVAAALAEYHRRERERRVERRRPVEAVRASFAAALDARPAGGRADLVFGYDGGPVVRDLDGAVVWRPGQPPAMRGKDLHHILRGVIGDRNGSLRTDLAGAPWWFWAPDE